jgi:hypothetical protein
MQKNEMVECGQSQSLRLARLPRQNDIEIALAAAKEMKRQSKEEATVTWERVFFWLERDFLRKLERISGRLWVKLLLLLPTSRHSNAPG